VGLRLNKYLQKAKRNFAKGGKMKEQANIKRICFISTILYVSILASIFIFLTFLSNVNAADVTVALNPKKDQSAVGYRIYYGTCSGIYTSKIDTGNVKHIRIRDLNKSQTYYFTATTYDHDGNESRFSEKVVYDPSLIHIRKGWVTDKVKINI
jgi:hypothetical protein